MVSVLQAPYKSDIKRIFLSVHPYRNLFMFTWKEIATEVTIIMTDFFRAARYLPTELIISCRKRPPEAPEGIPAIGV